MEKNRFIFRENGKSGKKSFRIALVHTVPEVFLKSKFVTHFLRVEGEGHALHGSHSLVSGQLAALFKYGRGQALALISRAWNIS